VFSGACPSRKLFMAKNSILCLDIGTTALKYVSLEETEQGIMLQGIKIIDLPEELEPRRLVEILAGILSETKSKEFALSFSGRYALIRSVAIPAVIGAKVESTLKIEVQHRIPFPLDQVIWSSHRLEESEGMLNFIVGAVKKELVEKLITPFKKFTQEIVFLDADPLVLLNLIKLKHDFNPEKTYALLEMGAESSNLIIFQRSSLLVRALTISGNTFTDNLKEERNIDRSAAEEEKLALTGTDLPLSINTTIDNLLAEIQNSLDYWRFTQKGPEVDLFYLTGGATSMSGFDQVLQNRLRIPCQVLDPLESVRIPEGVSIPTVTKNRLAVAVGLALRTMPSITVPYRLDFLSPDYLRLKESRRNQVFVYLSSLLAIVLAFTPSYFLFMETKVKQSVIEQLNTDLQTYEQYLPRKEDLEREIVDLKGRYESLNNTLNARYLWLSRLIAIGRVLPSEEIYLTRFMPNGDIIELDGDIVSRELSTGFKNIRQFILNLNALPNFQNATVVSLERNQQGILVFKVTVQLKAG